MPRKEFSPEEAVAAQMDALLNNDTPWPNHGIQTMYEFGWDIGGMERSRYFGYSKDLYHFDHFLGQFQNTFGDLLGADSCKIAEIRTLDTDIMDVDVIVQRLSSHEEKLITFRMQKKESGRREGSWMTKAILRQ
ncbi:hypothetical protein COCSUDRAFT_33613 [Coccomyxa subellipsoidea C-169]|uniref:Uncharacterized protein n=1 Tax=Coccomyxa subellipsoidea (strain C-169) TaxID=574566 RepID=I0YUC9_COCSC|nr:hypothetical protein COCSUDRAFT_33613 [Coccomyxa subellipsoidea C-169]EIE21998.1 hypothetical protein COCSUDRAFT_33613 [Coccomyxa subellipsoidea C-169]|eukprot:XP_005646542.1 hypothetical protein COCSUDRAFT_33613 [Coccomyxa subellipsoidea C-169]